MPRQNSDVEKFSRLVEALEPWLGQIIFVGGWAHRLHRERPEAASVTHEPLSTDDADVALTAETFRRSENIRTRLLALGFVENMSGDDQPPVTQYALGSEDAEFYAEFLTPLVGGERRRDGSPDVTERVAGVIAQKLRYLEVLLVAPWSVTVTKEAGFAVSEARSLQIPNAASYVVQKLLIHDRRKPRDRAKDVLYILDTIELFAGSLPTLRKSWDDAIAPTLRASAVRVVRAQVENMFGAVTDTVRDAALIASTRRLTPTSIQERCRAGLLTMLGSP